MAMESFDKSDPSAHQANPLAGPSDNQDSVENLWKVVVVIAFAVLLASVSFNAFLMKENGVLMFQKTQIYNQIQAVQQVNGVVSNLVQDVAAFSLQHPDVRPILQKYGVTINFVPAPPPVQKAPPPIPTPDKR